MDFRPAIISAMLIPVVLINIWLTVSGKESVYFMTWVVFITVLINFYTVMSFVEIFKELKRRRENG